MAKKYLDDTGMSYFWGKLKDYFQAKLVSGTNIKTINSESILGSGDIDLPTPADYVVEQGTSDIWTYRKWNSGIAECWGTTAYRSVSTTSAFGNAYYGSLQTITYPSGLFTVAPKATITILSGNGLWAGITSETTASVSYYPYAPKNQSHTIAEQVKLIGGWK